MTSAEKAFRKMFPHAMTILAIHEQTGILNALLKEHEILLAARKEVGQNEESIIAAEAQCRALLVAYILPPAGPERDDVVKRACIAADFAEECQNDAMAQRGELMGRRTAVGEA